MASSLNNNEVGGKIDEAPHDLTDLTVTSSRKLQDKL